MSNPFRGSGSDSTIERVVSSTTPRRGNIYRDRYNYNGAVPLTCKVCGDKKYVPTDDFRLNYTCDICKGPPLIAIMNRFLKDLD